MPMYVTPHASLPWCLPPASPCTPPPHRLPASAEVAAAPICLLEALTSPPLTLPPPTASHIGAGTADRGPAAEFLQTLQTPRRQTASPAADVGLPPGLALPLPSPPGLASPCLAALGAAELGQPCVWPWPLADCMSSPPPLPPTAAPVHGMPEKLWPGAAASPGLSVCGSSDQGSTVGPSSEDDATPSFDDDERDDRPRGGWGSTPNFVLQPSAGLRDSCMAGDDAAPAPAAQGAWATKDLGAELALHNAGICEPCAWFWKSSGCHRGANCKFCHLCPDGTLKARKKIKQAMVRQFRSATRLLPPGH